MQQHDKKKTKKQMLKYWQTNLHICYSSLLFAFSKSTSSLQEKLRYFPSIIEPIKKRRGIFWGALELKTNEMS